MVSTMIHGYYGDKIYQWNACFLCGQGNPLYDSALVFQKKVANPSMTGKTLWTEELVGIYGNFTVGSGWKNCRASYLQRYSGDYKQFSVVKSNVLTESGPEIELLTLSQMNSRPEDIK